jgi:hypothetical protein
VKASTVLSALAVRAYLDLERKGTTPKSLCVLVLAACSLSAQDSEPFKPRTVSFVGGLEYHRVDLTLPEPLISTPTHPDDVDASRPPRSQTTPISGGKLVPAGSAGVKLRPIRVKYLYPLAFGLTRTYFSVNNNFREGTLMARLPYQYFICGRIAGVLPVCEEAYTYARVSRFGPRNQFNIRYQFLALPRNQPDKQFFLEIGGHKSLSRVGVTQGWDRYNKDEVWRTSNGKTSSWGGSFGIGIGDDPTVYGKFAIEVERSRIVFPGLPARYFWTVSFKVVSFEISPFRF